MTSSNDESNLSSGPETQKNQLADEGKPANPEAAQQDNQQTEVKTRAEIQKLLAETEKLRLESRHFDFPSPKWLQLITAFFAVFGAFATAGAAVVGIFAATFQFLSNQEQAQRFHEDEFFYKAIGQLGSADAKERAASVVAITDYALRSANYKNQALTLIAIELQSETDPAVLKVSIETLPRFGMDALEVLIQNNREAYDRLARATGRYLGIQALRQKIIKVRSQDTLDDKMASYLFKLPLIAEHTSLPWQEAFTSDAEFFQTPDQLEIHPGFRSAFEQTVRLKRASPSDEAYAQSQFERSLRNLWINTQAIVAMLKALSGKVAGINLRKTVLIHPHLTKVDLRGIDTRSAVWMAPILRSADLSFADLSGAEMKYADLRQATLVGTTVAGVNFGELDPDLEKRTLVRIRFLQGSANFSEANFWDLANKSYLFGRLTQGLNTAKLPELEKRRAEIRDTPAAKEYLSKISQTFIDD